jgi:hypothetical protein
MGTCSHTIVLVSEFVGVQKSSTRKSSNNATVAQSLHFRPPNLLYQVINFTDVRKDQSANPLQCPV